MYSLELEQQLIAALLQHRQKYFEICDHINSETFHFETNRTIFSFIKNIYDKGDSVDAVILSEKIKLQKSMREHSYELNNGTIFIPK